MKSSASSRQLHYRIKTIEHAQEIPLRAELFVKRMEDFLVHLERYNAPNETQKFNTLSTAFMGKAQKIVDSGDTLANQKDKFQSETLLLIREINNKIIAQLGAYSKLYPGDILDNKEYQKKEGKKIGMFRAGLGALVLGAVGFFGANVLDLDLGISWRQIKNEIWPNSQQTQTQQNSPQEKQPTETKTPLPLKPVHPDEAKRKNNIATTSDLIDLVNDLSVKTKDFEEKYSHLNKRSKELKKQAEETIGGDGDPNDDDNLVKRLEEKLAVKKIQRIDYLLAREIQAKSGEIESLSLSNLSAAQKELREFRTYLTSVKKRVSSKSESGKAYTVAHHIISKKESDIQTVLTQRKKKKEQSIQILVDEINRAIDKRAYIKSGFSISNYQKKAHTLGNPKAAVLALQNLRKHASSYGQHKTKGVVIERQTRTLGNKVRALTYDNNYQGFDALLEEYKKLNKGLGSTALYLADDKAVEWLKDLLRKKMGERGDHISSLNTQIKNLESVYKRNQETYQKLEAEIVQAAENNSAVSNETLTAYEKCEIIKKETETQLQKKKTKLRLLSPTQK